MTTQPAPLLTSDDANYALITKDVDDVRAELQALADGRTACVRVMSEEECRAEFEREWPVTDVTNHDERRIAARWWLASRRAAGLIREGGT